MTVFQRLASKMGESRRFLRSTDTQEEFKKVLRIINDANPDQLASFSGCSKLHEHVQSSVPYVLDDNFKMNPLNLKSVEAQVKYNDYLLRMGVIGSPTGQSTRNIGSIQTCEVGVQGDEILNLNIRGGTQSAKAANTHQRYTKLAQSPSRVFYSVAGRKISIPVPNERPLNTKQSKTSGAMSKLFMKYNKQISDQRNAIDRFSSNPFD